uniref:Kinesin family member 6 n=1 Tax=Anser brachyrhynchus TaxID=132585 RepID=A0A8B9CRG5_9AVES
PALRRVVPGGSGTPAGTGGRGSSDWKWLPCPLSPRRCSQARFSHSCDTPEDRGCGEWPLTATQALQPRRQEPARLPPPPSSTEQAGAPPQPSDGARWRPAGTELPSALPSPPGRLGSVPWLPLLGWRRGAMVKETIRVYARLKPLGRRQQAGIYSVDDDEKSVSSLEIIVPHDLADGFVNNKRENYKFKFQKIFDQEAKQDVVFDSIAKPVAE